MSETTEAKCTCRQHLQAKQGIQRLHKYPHPCIFYLSAHSCSQ